MLVRIERRWVKAVIAGAGALIAGVLIVMIAGAPATASARPLSDSPTPFAPPAFVDLITTENDQGLYGPYSNLELFGPSSCASLGDPYSSFYLSSFGGAANSNYDDISPQGVYKYRIAIPSSYDNNLVRVELLDPQTANFSLSGASGAADLPEPVMASSAYWPTTVKNVNYGNVAITATNRCEDLVSGDRRNPCVHGKVNVAPIDVNNPLWFVRMDENRNQCTAPVSYTPGANTDTKFILYYYKEMSSGLLVRNNLAQYTGKSDGANAAEAFQTALKWVSPIRNGGTYPTPTNEQMPAFNAVQAGVASAVEPRVAVDACPSPCSATSNADFIINLSDLDFNGQPGNEATEIYTDPETNMRYIYLEVQGTAGGSENAFSVWAGPARSEDPMMSAPSFVNARQLYILHNNNLSVDPIEYHSSGGIEVFAGDHLPQNSLTNARRRTQIANFSADYSGATVSVKFWDADAGTQSPIALYFDTIPQDTWSACWGTNATVCSNEGSTQAWQYMGLPVNFSDAYGGSTAWGIFTIKVPGPTDPDHPMAFTGGRLMVDYQGGLQDTYNITITVAAPGAPTLVSPADVATVDGTPQYSWSRPDGAAGYQYEYDDNSDFSSPVYTSGDLTSTSFTPPSQTIGTYYWHVRARNVVRNWGSWSGSRSVTITLPDPPAAPSDLSATAISSAQIDLAWTDNADNEPGYKIERSPAGANTWAQIDTVGADAEAYSDMTVTCGTGYDYRVTATNIGGDSAASNTASATTGSCVPAAPTSLTATPFSSSRIDLAWTDNANNETGFRIERSAAGANTWALIHTAAADAEAYSDTTVTCATGYDYRVIATNTGVDSTASNTASATSGVCVPGGPTALMATTVSRRQINLTWTDNSGTETGFKVERSLAGSNTWTLVTTTAANSTSYQDTGLTCATGYDYRVIATNGTGDSAPSTTETATTNACISGTPGKPKITTPAKTLLTNDPTPDFGWNAAANTDTYRLQISTSSKFKTTLQDVPGIEGTSWTAGALGDGVYYMRVQGVNSLGTAGKWSATRKVTVDLTPPEVPALKSANSSSRPTLAVVKVGGAARYEYRLWADASPGIYLVDVTITGTSYKLTAAQALGPGAYHWQARAIDAAGNPSPWSAEWSVTSP